jgi:hypothetical protein
MASSAISGGLSITKARSWKPWSPRNGTSCSAQRSTRGWPTAQQSGGEFPLAPISTARAGHAAVSKDEDPAKIQFNSRRRPQPFQSGASSRQPRRLQPQTLSRAGRVAHSRRLIGAWVWANYGTRRRPAVTLTLPTSLPLTARASLRGLRVHQADGDMQTVSVQCRCSEAPHHCERILAIRWTGSPLRPTPFHDSQDAEQDFLGLCLIRENEASQVECRVCRRARMRIPDFIPDTFVIPKTSAHRTRAAELGGHMTA